MTTDQGTASAALSISPSSRVRRAPAPISERDLVIVRRALTKLGAERIAFDDAVRALNEATEEVIPAGRCYFLGQRFGAPVIGSRVSGVGIAQGGRDGRDGVVLVRQAANGQLVTLGSFASFASARPGSPASFGSLGSLGSFGS